MPNMTLGGFMDANEIKKEFKSLNIVFTINMIVRIINLVLIIILAIIEGLKISESNFMHNNYLFLFVLAVLNIIIPAISLSELRKIVIAPNTSYAIEILKRILKGCAIIPLLFVFVSAVALIFQYMEIMRALGYASLGTISFIFCVLMTWVAYGNIKKSQQETTETIAQDAIDKVTQENIVDETKKRETTLRLLEEIGRKFFIKYYEKLKNWSIPDIVDIIEENYSEESKLTRIKQSKKIFGLNLDKMALEIISNDTQNLIDNDTRQKATYLLQK